MCTLLSYFLWDFGKNLGLAKIPTVLFFTLEKFCLGTDFVMFQMKYFVNVGCKSMILVEGVDFKAW